MSAACRRYRAEGRESSSRASPHCTPPINMRRYLPTIGPRSTAGVSSPVNMPIDIVLTPCRSAGITLPSGVAAGGWPVGMPSMPGILGPRTSASTSPTRAPRCCSTSARLTLTVDFPTPPLPLPMATIWRIPGSFSGLTWHLRSRLQTMAHLYGRRCPRGRRSCHQC